MVTFLFSDILQTFLSCTCHSYRFSSSSIKIVTCLQWKKIKGLFYEITDVLVASDPPSAPYGSVVSLTTSIWTKLHLDTMLLSTYHYISMQLNITLIPVFHDKESNLLFMRNYFECLTFVYLCKTFVLPDLMNTGCVSWSNKQGFSDFHCWTLVFVEMFNFWLQLSLANSNQ